MNRTSNLGRSKGTRPLGQVSKAELSARQDEATSPTAGQIVRCRIEGLKPYARNARTHTNKQIKQIARSIERFGFVNPVLTGVGGQIVAGHGRVEAARMLGMDSVPTLSLSHLNANELRAYVLADNKIALNAGWDEELLALEMQDLIDLDFDLELTGFCLAEIDLTLDAACDKAPKQSEEGISVPRGDEVAVSLAGDLWQLGDHRLLCGDARERAHFNRLLGGEAVDLLFTDPPYNVPIDGNVCGLGATRHREFALASGEMSGAEFSQFLTITLGHAAAVMRDGAIAYVCMDWRHMGELLEAGRECFMEMKNLVVWNKSNGGMGTFYRSKHELIFVFKNGSAPHVNSFGLGESGRHRTNVWDYPGISSMSATRSEELAMHPTVKPVAMIADAIRDCSKRGQIVLDCFAGSGSTLIAAERSGRRARLIEYDPLYCDTIIRRWEGETGRGRGSLRKRRYLCRPC